MDMDFWPLLRSRDRVLNAGVDINGFQPVTFEELLENNRSWKGQNGKSLTDHEDMISPLR